MTRILLNIILLQGAFLHLQGQPGKILNNSMLNDTLSNNSLIDPNLSNDSTYWLLLNGANLYDDEKYEFSAATLLSRQIFLRKANLLSVLRLPKMLPKPDSKRKQAALNFTRASIFNTVTSAPLLLLDSSFLTVQNNLQLNFSATALGQVGFDGYISYRKVFLGVTHDYFDFKLTYTGIPKNTPDQNAIHQAFRKALTESNIFDSVVDYYKQRAYGLNKLLGSVDLINKVIAARKMILDFRADSSSPFIDTVELQYAKKLDSLYNRLSAKKHQVDSLIMAISLCRDRFKSIVNRCDSYADLVSNVSHEFGIQQQNGLRNVAAGNIESKRSFQLPVIKKFGIGKIFPNQSELTLKNMTLKGADLQVVNGRFIHAVSAGIIDYRLNQVVQKRRNDRPLPSAFVVYTGYNVNKHLLMGLRYFAGKKDNYAAGIIQPFIHGLAVEVILGGREKMISVELAKNINQPVYEAGKDGENTFWSLHDRNSMAVAIKSMLYIKRTKTSFNGSLSTQGKYYNTFNSNSVNSKQKRYDFKFAQKLFKGSISVTGWMRNTEYTPVLNGILLQTDVSLRSFTATFHKSRWPLLSISYNPIKQMFLSDSIIQLSIYNAFCVVGDYTYKIGIRKANTSFAFNKLAHNQNGSSVQNVMANSMNIVADHYIDFESFKSNLNFSYTGGQGYAFLSAGSGVVINMLKNISLKGGVSINDYNHISQKIGGSFGMQTIFGDNCLLSADFTRSYIPFLSGKKVSEFSYGNLCFRYTFIKSNHNVL